MVNPNTVIYTSINKIACNDDHLEDITIVICSNNLNNFLNLYRDLEILSRESKFKLLFIYDNCKNAQIDNLNSFITATNIRIVVNGINKGLSYSRNQALKLCKTNFLLFIDDDVSIDEKAINILAAALITQGRQVVGACLILPKGTILPCYILPGQLHYLGVHNFYDSFKVPWGACLGVDVNFCRDFNIDFVQKLGRQNASLQSGDDTTFVYEIQKNGGAVVFIEDLFIQHNVNHSRISYCYMWRRTIWQGRSEVMRKNIIRGLKKEWRRYTLSKRTSLTWWKYIIAIKYLSVFLLGVIIQIAYDAHNSFGFGQHSRTECS
jgi:glycosyltransferase involved in cell wall biosynthesis